MANHDATRIPHTAGGTTTRDDPGDLGVPMRPLAPGEAPRQGPEDALDPEARGDYRDRLGGGRHTTTRARYRHRYDLAPEIERVDQGPRDAAKEHTSP